MMIRFNIFSKFHYNILSNFQVLSFYMRYGPTECTSHINARKFWGRRRPKFFVFYSFTAAQGGGLPIGRQGRPKGRRKSRQRRVF